MNVLRDSYHLSNHLIIQDVLNARYIISLELQTVASRVLITMDYMYHIKNMSLMKKGRCTNVEPIYIVQLSWTLRFFIY